MTKIDDYWILIHDIILMDLSDLSSKLDPAARWPPANKVTEKHKGVRRLRPHLFILISPLPNWNPSRNCK